MNQAFSNLVSDIGKQPYQAVVAMAVYHQDRLEWVEQAVNSILQQSFSEFVFVVVIDGQVEPGLKAFLVKIASQDKRVVVFQHRQNGGLSVCMNFAIDYMLHSLPAANYFLRMDADDISERHRLAQQIDFFKHHKHISVLGSALKEVNELGKVVGKRKLPRSHGDIVKFLPKRCSINHPTVAVRRAVFEAGHRYDETLKNTQDYFFWIDLCRAGYRFSNLPDMLLRFRRVNDFYKRRGLNKSLNEFKARFYAMRTLDRYTVGNVIYAFLVLSLRMMPAKMVKLAYKIDRFLLNKKVRHQ